MINLFVTTHTSFKRIRVLIVEKLMQLNLNAPANPRQRLLCEYLGEASINVYTNKYLC